VTVATCIERCNGSGSRGQSESCFMFIEGLGNGFGEHRCVNGRACCRVKKMLLWDFSGTDQPSLGLVVFVVGFFSRICELRGDTFLDLL